MSEEESKQWTEEDENNARDLMRALHLMQEVRTGDLDDDDMEWIRAETVLDKMRNGRGHYSDALFKQLEEELTAEELDTIYRNRLLSKGTIRYREWPKPYVEESASWKDIEKFMRKRALEYKDSSCAKDREWARYFLSQNSAVREERASGE